ncbi:DUF952 domain-containing protein [Rhodococcus sp. NPDC058521]|uniref:DUF952 domain-containing protein n=1 Tax=Rhodococcus sp. NPDC058521 TaxID=3346536 RepID=UPI00365CDE6A
MNHPTEPDQPSELVHICSREEWASAQIEGQHVPAGFGTEGFVHLSMPSQVHLPANRLFAGRTDLVLLEVDPGRVGAPIRWEPGVPSEPDSMVFPHLYGPLPVESVLSVEDYLPGSDGQFAPRT